MGSRSLIFSLALLASVACGKAPLPVSTPVPATPVVIEKIVEIEVIREVEVVETVVANLVSLSVFPYVEQPFLILRYDTDGDGVPDLFQMRRMEFHVSPAGVDYHPGPVIETKYDRDQDGVFDEEGVMD